MSYRVRTDNFEGPFDLLLYLVSRQRVDIGSISIAEITDQYLAEVNRMKKIDLDVTSDFVLVASTLLELKAASLLPKEKPELSPEMEEYSPEEMRDALVNHLIEYKKFKNAALSLGSRLEAQDRLHFRMCGPDRSVIRAVPDYLRGIEIEHIAEICAKRFAHQDVFLLESEHIEESKVSLETQIKKIYQELQESKTVNFSALLSSSASKKEVVATFLAVLELFKRSMVDLKQSELFGDIQISYKKTDAEVDFDSMTFDSLN